MSINLYLVSSDDIREKLWEFIAAYSDLNGHFSGTDVTKGSLLTIYTDLDPNHLALELRIPVTKLHSINQSSRRKSSLRSTLFAFDNVDIEVTEELIGSNLYKQYNLLRRNHQKKLEESLNRSRNQRTAEREKLDTSTRVKGETVYYSEEDLTFTEGKMDLSGIPEYLIPRWNTADDNGLEDFILGLESALEMGVIRNEKMLIYCAMTRSGKTSVLDGLTTEKESVQAFAAWLREHFGPTPSQQRLNFNNLRQKTSQSEVDFFMEIETKYFRSRGITKPVGNGFTDHMKNDIRFAFIQGLRNREVTRLLYVNGETVEYERLATLAKTYATALDDVNKVFSVRTSNVNRINGLERKLEDMELKIDNPTYKPGSSRGHRRPSPTEEEPNQSRDMNRGRSKLRRGSAL